MKIIIAISLFSTLMLSALLMIMPSFTLWFLLYMSMLVSGTVGYFFPQFASIQWGVALISYVLFLRTLPILLISSRSPKESTPIFLKLFILFAISVLCTTLINRHWTEFLISSKNLFQFWSIPLAFYFIIKKDNLPEMIMKTLLWIAILQTPFAIIQRLFFAGAIAGDSVTGTFGGHMMGGGPNAALSIFLASQIGVLLSLAIKKIMGWRYAILGTIWLLIPIALANAKAIIFFFAVMMLILFKDNILRRRSVTIIGSIIFILLMVGTILYQKYDWERSPYGSEKSMPGYIEYIIKKNIELNDEKKLNRLTVYTFWWQENIKRYEFPKLFFGHGLGSTKRAGLLTGHVQSLSQYQEKKLGYTALSTLLWEVGLFGTLSYLLIFSSAFFLAGRLKKNSNLDEINQTFMNCAQIACLFFLMSLPYKLAILNVQAFNAYSMFILGYLAFWSHKLPFSNKAPGINSFDTKGLT